MVKKQGFTYERHQEIGQKLYQMRQELTLLGIETGNSFSFWGKYQPYKKIYQLITVLDALRSDFEELYARDFPDTWEIATYYEPENRNPLRNNGTKPENAG